MKALFIIWLFISLNASGQSAELEQSVKALDRSLMERDTGTLRRLLHPEVEYGHSNGWVETREDVITDLVTSKLVYHQIQSEDFAWKETGDWAIVRSTALVDCSLNGKRMQLKLHVMQVWKRSGNGWQLLGRQSAKLS